MGLGSALTNWLSFRSLENPSTSLSNPGNWLLDLWGGKSDSGINVTPETSLQVATWWQCISLLSDDFAKLPVDVFKNDRDGNREKDRKHPSYYLLRRKVNPRMTAGLFKKLLLAHVFQYGNGYAYIARDAGARPESILLLDPTQTTPMSVDGELFYVTYIGGQRKSIPQMDVIHLRGLGFDGLEGYSVLEFARNSIGLSLAAEKYGNKHFANGTRTSGVLQYPGRLKPETAKKLAADFQKKQSGLDNAGKVILLEENAKFIALSQTPNEAQMIELREFQRKEIASWFKIPPSKLGDPDSVSYNSLEQWNRAYLESALDPWLCAFEEECFDKLLTEHQKRRDTHFIEINRGAILRTDLSSRYDGYAKARQWGWFSVNDIRRMENEQPIGEEGDTYLVPANMMDAKDLGKEEVPEALPAPEADNEEDNDLTETNTALLDDVMSRMARRLGETVKRSVRHDDWSNRLETSFENYITVCIRAVTPAIDAMNASQQRHYNTRSLEAYFEGMHSDLQQSLSDIDRDERIGMATDWTIEVTESIWHEWSHLILGV